MKKRAPTRPRRPYAPPRLTRVKVRLDEAVLCACKSGGLQTGPGGLGCVNSTGACSEPTS